MEAILVLIVFGFIVFAIMLSYKKRLAISRWLEDPSMSASYSPKLKRRNLQRKIEDAELELEELDKIENTKEEK